MKVVPKKQADNRKVWLAVLGVVAAVAVYTNWGSDSSPAPAPGNTAAPATLPSDAGTPATTQQRGFLARRTSSEWRPKLRSNRPEDRRDPTKIDPTLRLDLLAKVQNVALEGGSRNLFQFGVAPPPPVPATPIKNPSKIAINNLPVVVPPPSGPPPPPAPVPIPLKYYGYSNARGEARKKAFFLDGDDIIVAWEGDIVKSRYKVIHVGVNSVDVEDTQLKNKQTLPLAEEAAG
jgi:hypothetical protein